MCVFGDVGVHLIFIFSPLERKTLTCITTLAFSIRHMIQVS